MENIKITVKAKEFLTALESINSGASKHLLNNILGSINISYDVDTSSIILASTNGNVLYTMPVKLILENDIDLPSKDFEFNLQDIKMTLDFIKHEIKTGSIYLSLLFIENKLTINDKFTTEGHEGHYPRYAQLLPEVNQEDILLKLGLPVLETLVNAMKKSAECKGVSNVTLHIRPEKHSAIVNAIGFESESNNNLSGVIMPIKISNRGYDIESIQIQKTERESCAAI